jgi:endonuclease/exonuclease/phosphatase family metal-dependent hydrolase
MRIVSLNTWKCDGAYRERLGLVAEGLAALAPDVLLLQEAFATEDGQADTAAFLARALSMHVEMVPARRKHRLFEGQARLSTSGLALLSRYPLQVRQVVELPSDEADGERIALLASVSLVGQDLWLANLHLTHVPDAGALRACQLQSCLEALRTVAGNAPWVIGGDFNAAASSAELACFLREPWGLTDPFAGQSKTTHRNEAGQHLDLDQILLTGQWPAGCVHSAFVAMEPWRRGGGPAPSDHGAGSGHPPGFLAQARCISSAPGRGQPW